MKRTRTWPLIALAVVGSAVFATAQDSADGRRSVADASDRLATEAPGRVTDVIAYRGQAQVTRQIDVPVGEGLMDLVVTGLPQYVIGGSLFADGGDGVAVRAIRYRQRVVGEDVSDERRELAVQIEGVERGVRENQVLSGMVSQQIQYLTRLDNYTAAAADVDIDRARLDVDALRLMTAFLFAERERLTRRSLALAEERNELNNRRSTLIQEIRRLGGGPSRVEREAVVFVEKTRGAATTLRLSYLVARVGWEPVYNMRAQSGESEADVAVEYAALVTQISGEDWLGVDLTLSTASPALVAMGASLNPLVVGLTASQERQDRLHTESLRGQLQALRFRQNQYARSGDDAPPSNQAGDMLASPAESSGGFAGGVSEFDRNQRMARELNSMADELQMLELRLTGRTAELSTDQYEQGISVEYAIDGRISLESRTDQQLVSIAELELGASFAFVATPVLSEYVYLQAEARNSSSVVLLEGPYSSYLDGRFVGRGAIPMVGLGESLQLGFGIDAQLRTTRTLVEKTVRTQGGNEVTTFRYRLSVTNYKDHAVAVRLIDRRPSSDGADIAVAVDRIQPALSEDALYMRDEYGLGILRWDLTVPANRVGADVYEVRYEVSLEYDRSMDLAPR